MANGILVLVEHQDGRPKKTSFELLGKAKSFGLGPVTALVVGAAGGMTAALASHGADAVVYAGAAELVNFQSGTWARALETAIRQADPVAVLATASSAGKDVLPRVAARLNAGLVADCTDLSAAGGRLKARRPVFSGKALVDVEIPSGLQLFSVRPNSFPVGAADGSRSASESALNVAFSAGDLRAKTVEVIKGASEKVDLTEAERIVSGGRSLGSSEAFKILEDLAGTLGAAVGASRAAVDAGYAPHDMQVGQTGKTVNPTLYLAFGISGAIQHLAGMRSSKVIVAINKDPDAPIFQVADYGLVADLFQAAPLLNAEFKKLLSN